jgi:diguanylate cyclase (GGDEF)-like protein/PAS domain S-box-containing protein
MSDSVPLRPSERASIGFPRLTIAGMAAGYATASILWVRFGGASLRVRDVVTQALFLQFSAGLVALFLLAARRPETRPPIRRALRFFAAAAAMTAAGNVVMLHAAATGTSLVPLSPADLCFIATFPVMLAGYLSIPVGGRQVDRWKFACDAGMVLAGSGLALWYFVLWPIATQGEAVHRTAAFGLVYPLGDLLLLVGIVTVVLRRPIDDHRGAMLWLGLGTAMSVIGDLSYNVAIIEGRQPTLLTEVFYLANAVAMVGSAELFWRYPASERPGRTESRRTRIGSILPFAVAGATYVLLCMIALRHWTAPLSGVALGAVAVSLCFGARQLLGYRQREVRAAEAAVRASEARFRSLVQHSSDLIFVLDAGGVIQFASSSARRLIGYEPDALVGVELSALVHPDDSAIVSSFVGLVSRHPGVSGAVEWRLRGTDATVVQVEAIASNRLGDDAVRGIVINARDVSERKALLDQLAHQAFHDSLTGLANRALFYDRVRHALDLGRRQARALTVLFLDLDDFKVINDTMGHAEGDRLLRMVADRLRASARATDTVARLGGDEFAVLVEDAAAARSAERLIARIREQMSFPFSLAGGEVSISASIGSATTVGGDVDEVLRHADLAMYSAKRSERGGHRAFEELRSP